MSTSYSRNNTSGSITNSWDTRFPLAVIDLWVDAQASGGDWVDKKSASADVAAWGVKWGAVWSRSAGWKDVNNVTNDWVDLQ